MFPTTTLPITAVTGMNGVASAARQISRLCLGRSWNSLLKFMMCRGMQWTASGPTEDWTTQWMMSLHLLWIGALKVGWGEGHGSETETILWPISFLGSSQHSFIPSSYVTLTELYFSCLDIGQTFKQLKCAHPLNRIHAWCLLND